MTINSSDYKSRLIKLNLLPLMMQFEINYIKFFVKNLRDPSQSFNVMDFVEFCLGSTRSSTFLKLKRCMSKLNSVKHFYFNCLPRLWNPLPSMDPKDPLSATKHKLRQCLWNHLPPILILKTLARFIMFVLAVNVHFCQYQISLTFHIFSFFFFFFSITLYASYGKGYTHSISNIKCTLTKERNKQQSDRKGYTTYN